MSKTNRALFTLKFLKTINFGGDARDYEIQAASKRRKLHNETGRIQLTTSSTSHTFYLNFMTLVDLQSQANDVEMLASLRDHEVLLNEKLAGESTVF